MEQSRPYIISWNLTYRCNLACEHCYLDAGATGVQKNTTPAFQDRGELTTEQCFAIVDQIQQFAPEAVTILTGGEPLLRKDLLEIVRYGSQKKLWVVVGTNGILITEKMATILKEAGARGLALSLDALDAASHDRFRKIQGAWQNTVSGAKILHQVGLPFIVQTTVHRGNRHQLSEIADFAYEEMKAKVFNLYFLVPSGRGQYVSEIAASEYNQSLKELSQIQKKYEGQMMVNAKCAPHYIRYLFAHEPQSPFLKKFSHGAGGCPAGTHYMGIRPNGDMTPCPYLPEFGGNLMRQNITAIWNDSEIFKKIRSREKLSGICGECEFSETCGGCRARAYGVTGDVLAADPLCDYKPGVFKREEICFETGAEYGLPLQEKTNEEIIWDAEALSRIQNIPAFVQGMVKKRMEEYCRDHGLPRVTLDILTEVRRRMPLSKVFARE